MDKGQQVTEQEIENGLSSLARLIDRYGDAYWPVFERLERELGIRKQRRRRLAVHLRTKQRPLNAIPKKLEITEVDDATRCS